MKPVYRVMTYTGPVNDYDITDNVVGITTQERLTESASVFAVTLPSDSLYEDIALHDKAKIYLGYDTAPATPTFVGRVTKIDGTYNATQGYCRKLSGLSQTEILLRLLKSSHYKAVDASAIAEEFADDLLLGKTKIVADTNEPELELVDQTYFDGMQSLSDYWISAGVQLKKDFYVDVDNSLVYKTRPLRTAGIETFTLGENIIDYAVERSVEPVKNNVSVHGGWDEKYASKNPYDENWTDSLTNWNAATGTLSLNVPEKQVGTYCIKCDAAGSGVSWDVEFQRTLKPEFAFVSGNARTTTKSFSRLHFMVKAPSVSSNDRVYLFAPDSSNYYYRAIAPSGGWDTLNYTLPTTDVTTGWFTIGAPEAGYITGLKWTHHCNSDFDYYLDDLALQGGRFVYKVSDAASISNYGQRDLVVIDDNLKSTAQCESRARTLLYQKKDPVLQVDINTFGNTNVLVGDQIALTLPRENVSGNYYVTAVDHTLNSTGFFTRFTSLDGVSNRTAAISTLGQMLGNVNKTLRALGRDCKLIR